MLVRGGDGPANPQSMVNQSNGSSQPKVRRSDEATGQALLLVSIDWHQDMVSDCLPFPGTAQSPDGFSAVCFQSPALHYFPFLLQDVGGQERISDSFQPERH